jgi:hypothetical protein
MNIATIAALGISFALLGQTPDAQKPTAAKAKAKLTTERTYKVGEEDVYKVEAKITGPMNAGMSGTIHHKVTKVYDTGDADIEETVTDVQSDGPMPPPNSDAKKFKLNSFNLADSKDASNPITWQAISTFLPKITDLLSDQEWPVTGDLPGDAHLNAVAKMVDSAMPLTEYGLQGKLGGNEHMNGLVKGDFVWDDKAKRYSRGKFVITMEDPSGQSQGTFVMTIGFEYVPPQKSAPKKTTGGQ